MDTCFEKIVELMIKSLYDFFISILVFRESKHFVLPLAVIRLKDEDVLILSVEFTFRN